MKRDLFAIVQIPFVDFRRFIPEPPTLVLKPSWPKPETNEFVRKFGRVRSRYLQDSEIQSETFLESAFPTEKYYVDASWQIIRDRWSLETGFLRGYSQAQFLRLIGDQQALVRFEIGVRVSVDAKSWHNVDRIGDAVEHIATDKIFQIRREAIAGPNGKVTRKHIDLTSLSANLRRRYYSASAQHDKTGARPPFNGRFLRPLDWSFCLELPARKKYRWLSEGNAFRNAGCGFDVAILRSPKSSIGNTRYSPSIATVGNHVSWGREEARRFRIHYLRMRAELQALWQVLSELRTGGLLEPFLLDANYHPNLRADLTRYLDRTVNRILDTVASNKDVMDSKRLVQVLWSEDLVSPDMIDELSSRAGGFLGPKLTSRVVDSLTHPGGYTNIFVGGSHTVGDRSMTKYEFKGAVTGAVGDGAKASDFVVNLAAGSADQDSLDRLASELSELIKHIKGEDGDVAQSKAAIAALEAAKSAAEKGDQASVLPALRAAASWVLEKASAIGVPVAVAALKKAIGL